MKRFQTSMLAVFACAAAVNLSAQSTAYPDQTQPKSGSMSQSANKVTVEGCVEKAKDSTAATGTSGTTGGGGDKYMLTNVTPAAASTGTAGTSGAAKATASSYRLDADESKLSAHVGHKVEITGTVEDRGAAGTSGTTGATGASASGGPRLKVESVKMISSSCTP